MKQRQQITIVGAGLVGSLLAVLLARRGYDLRVVEKRPDLRRAKIPAGRSINLALAERGIHALRQAGVMDAVAPNLIPMRGRLLHDGEGRLNFQPYGQRPEEAIHSVSRAKLNCILLDAAEATGRVDLRFSSSCEGIDLANNTVHCRDEMGGRLERSSFEFLVGADGAGSTVRDALIRATDGSCDVAILDHAYKELCIPAGPGGTFQMDRNALHIWPRGGYMLIALPNLDASFTVTMFLPKVGDPSFESLRDARAVEVFFQKQFPDVVPRMPNLVHDFLENPTGSMGTVRCTPWHYAGKALLIGDAAHALVPFHGQGMNCGFEDCVELLGCLDRHDDNWSATIAEYGPRRKPDTDAIAEMALENYVVMRDRVTDPLFRQKKELGFVLERRHPRRFIPQYSMVMFHRVPYAAAQQRGAVQEVILTELLRGASDVSQVDLEKADLLIESRLEEL
jgi:kynurenine 3-monooxygenase